MVVKLFDIHLHITVLNLYSHKALKADSAGNMRVSLYFPVKDINFYLYCSVTYRVMGQYPIASGTAKTPSVSPS